MQFLAILPKNNNKIKIILVLDKDFVQGLDNTTIYAEKMYSINFTENNKTFCCSLHYNGANSYLFNGTEIHKLHYVKQEQK